ncbi:unnamed protein product [Prorocentrum cordatum]|uniref:Uncharacterized protein n=1 Tax=Prorocentrum cordatum TaxID=2364126 RepID=A0ABN9XTU9_9DINO|nr:unnamed protein product [Polarella glacialis]
MFAPIGSQASQGQGTRRPREGAAAEAAGEDGTAVGPGGVRKLDKLFAKLLLQHETNFNANSREDNFTLTMAADDPVQVALATSEDSYNRKGKQAREEAEEGEYKGHPDGKKPDFLLRAVIFRITEAAEAKSQEVKAAAGSGAMAQQAAAALDTLAKYKAIAQNPQARVVATRCFHGTVKPSDGGMDEEKDDDVRWIFAMNSHRELKDALETLRVNGCLAAARLNLGYDHGPKSGVAKEIETTVFRRKGAKGDSKKKAKKR